MNEYKTSGVCSKKISFDIKDGTVSSVSFEGGCDGNLKAISRLVEGMKTKDVLERLKGLKCDAKPTSCADQLAQAVEAAATE